jgi:hypothetical protein
MSRPWKRCLQETLKFVFAFCGTARKSPETKNLKVEVPELTVEARGLRVEVPGLTMEGLTMRSLTM